MASSVISICNRALSEMGGRSTITSLSEPTPAGIQCSLWYDNLRQQLIRTAPWGFCRRQIVLTQLGDLNPDATSPYPWLFKYAYPSDCLRIRYLLPPPPPQNSVAPITGQPLIGPGWMSPSRTNRFIIHNDVLPDGTSQKVLLSNLQNASAVYNGDIEEVNIFDDLFECALVSALAFKLVISLSGNVGMRDGFAKIAQQAILDARAADGNEGIPSSDIKVDWIETRGVGAAFGYGPYAGGVLWGGWTEGWSSMNWGS